ncbi:MAG: DUF5667 domain-containing protein, partial [Chloroflexota bacterium]|nr:DUF5667 domain-containing protein [Chloroflexota bacterium]
MSPHDANGGSVPPQPSEPAVDLLLAQALDACIGAERQEAGSSAAIVAEAPESAREQLRQLVALAQSVETTVQAVTPSPEFRAAARMRLMQRIAGPGGLPVDFTAAHLRSVPAGARGRRRGGRWLLRGGAGLAAAAIFIGATLTASASALPGDPLYGLKQAQEEVVLRLATDDQARVLAQLQRAEARLDETARLLQQGRTSEAVQAAQRYDQAIERVTTTLVVSLEVDRSATPGLQQVQSRLAAQHERLQSLLQTAPEPARPELRDALATTERGRELVADTHARERALGLRGVHSGEAAANEAAPSPPGGGRQDAQTPAV